MHHKRLIVFTLSLVFAGMTNAAAQEGWSWSKLNPFASQSNQTQSAGRTAMVDGSPLIGALSKPATMGASAVRRVQDGTGRAFEGAAGLMPWKWSAKSTNQVAPWAQGARPANRGTEDSSSWLSWFKAKQPSDGPRTAKEFLDQDRPNWGG